MPFTLSHIAIILPFKKKIVRFELITAMIIGSMMPDLVYFLPINLGRMFSHSFKAVYIFHVPVGMLLFYLYQCFFKKPLVELLPDKFRNRISRYSFSITLKTVVLQLVFMLIGIFSHLIWDSFTHSTGIFVQVIPFLQRQILPSVENGLVIFSFMQYFSSFIGILVIVLMVRSWYKKAEVLEDKPTLFSKKNRRFFLLLIIVLPIIIPLILSLRYSHSGSYLLYLKELAIWLTFTGGTTFLFVIVLWSTIWNLIKKTSKKKLILP